MTAELVRDGAQRGGGVVAFVLVPAALVIVVITPLFYVVPTLLGRDLT